MYKNLFSPFSYLRIKHQIKWKADWLYPFYFSALSLLAIYVFKQFAVVDIYSSDGMISKIIDFVQTLPGFYFAGLAVVATFQKNGIDKIMPAPAPKLQIRIHGKKEFIELTRRRFLCSLFAFLTVESMLLILFSIFAQSFYKAFQEVVSASLHELISYIFLSFYLTIFWQLIIATLLGLYYLGDRLHQTDL